MGIDDVQVCGKLPELRPQREKKGNYSAGVKHNQSMRIHKEYEGREKTQDHGWPPSVQQSRMFFYSVRVCSFYLWHFCCAYRLDLRWTHIVDGGDVNTVHRWQRERHLILFVCRWTSCNFEQETWMIQLPCLRVQAKTYFHLSIRNGCLSLGKSWFLWVLHTFSLSLRMKAKWTKYIQKFKLNKKM